MNSKLDSDHSYLLFLEIIILQIDGIKSELQKTDLLNEDVETWV